jgi:glucan phosphoethanolaminetransferase (alkaline phosphatase superfamily)
MPLFYASSKKDCKFPSLIIHILTVESIFKNTVTLSEITAMTLLIKLMLTTCLMVVITQVYKYTHQSLSYVHTFLHTLIIVGVTTCAILMIIGQSLPMAFGLLGALSIIRCFDGSCHGTLCRFSLVNRLYRHNVTGDAQIQLWNANVQTKSL